MGLVEKMRAAREQTVDVGGFKFRVRRPTDVEVMDLRGNVSVAALVRYVVGWDGVRELDLLPGGDPHPLVFDAAVAAEWLADRPDLLTPLSAAIMDAYRAHVEAMGVATKN
jgi:hypothetical protein